MLLSQLHSIMPPIVEAMSLRADRSLTADAFTRLQSKSLSFFYGRSALSRVNDSAGKPIATLI